jgi:hypothetical protein
VSGAWKITAEELGKAVVRPAPRPAGGFSYTPRAPLPPPSNRLAWASFVTALAGIPLFGVLTGLVAILLGCVAVGRGPAGRRGAGLALAGILLGLADVVGWLVFLSFMLGRPSPLVSLDDVRLDPKALENLDPVHGRAMRANVVITTAHKGALGSGVILRIRDEEALVVTNRHVVDPDFTGSGKAAQDAPRLPDVTVLLLGQPERPGKVIWVAPHGIDLALVRAPCDTAEARAAAWQRHRPVRGGETVFAVGNPHGLGWTQTQGVLSQLRRQDHGGFDVQLLQTQAALNFGNSGGGLFDQEGYLIGINTWVKDKRVSEGLGFAIAFDTLLDLAPKEFQLEEKGKPGEK